MKISHYSMINSRVKLISKLTSTHNFKQFPTNIWNFKLLIDITLFDCQRVSFAFTGIIFLASFYPNLNFKIQLMAGSSLKMCVNMSLFLILGGKFLMRIVRSHRDTLEFVHHKYIWLLVSISKVGIFSSFDQWWNNLIFLQSF